MAPDVSKERWNVMLRKKEKYQKKKEWEEREEKRESKKITF